MPCYLVSYDLCNRDHDYSALYQTLESFPNWARPMESAWFVVSNLKPSLLREKLACTVDPQDKILIVKASKKIAWNGVPDCMSTWMGRYL